jgi:hypothetical protein
MDLFIQKNAVEPVSADVDYGLFLSDPAPIEILLKYNEALAGVQVAHKDDLNYLISPTLCRLEAQTYLFDAVWKCKFLLEKLDAEPGGLRIRNASAMAVSFLADEAKRRGYRVETVADGMGPFGRFKRSKAYVCVRLCLLTIYTFFVSLVSKLLLPEPEWDTRYVLISFYDFRSKTDSGEYADPYFKPLIGRLRERGEKFAVLVNIMGKKGFLKVIRTLLDLRSMSRTFPVIVVERLLRWRDAAQRDDSMRRGVAATRRTAALRGHRGCDNMARLHGGATPLLIAAAT